MSLDRDPGNTATSEHESERLIELNRRSIALRRRSSDALTKSRNLRERCSRLSELIAQLRRMLESAASESREQ